MVKLMRSKFEIVYFDLDNTLLDFSRSERQALNNVFKTLGLELTESDIDTYISINKKWWKLFSDGKYSKDRIVVARFEEFLKFLGINNIEPSVVANMYLEHLSQLAFFLTGAEEMLQKLKDSNQRMAVLTNGVKRVQHSRSKILNLGRYMEFVLTSEEAGKPKPDPALFILASKISGVPLNRSVYVGDDPVTDKQGAQNAGVDFILFDPKNTYNLSDIRVVHNFTELFNILSCSKTSKGIS